MSGSNRSRSIEIAGVGEFDSVDMGIRVGDEVVEEDVAIVCVGERTADGNVVSTLLREDVGFGDDCNDGIFVDETFAAWQADRISTKSISKYGLFFIV